MSASLSHLPARLKVVFLDRDGVINRDSPDYIKNWSEFEFLSGSLAAMARLTRAGFSLMLITNQSAVARGLISRTGLGRLHQRLRAAVAEKGGQVKEIFFCPHHPDEGCRCRKPAGGMLQQAAAKYGLDLSASVLIGDSVKDIQCARAGGCGTSVLVQTGNGRSALETLIRRGQPPDYVADDLLDAAGYIETNVRNP
ncbi:MAG: D-glycero-beta-D-manno-heptose 1,7-bisphosphate 7-phosphatase [Desulfosarcinaceae bacterium]|jgi:D-glycero-D-manno-heptose 1,7-bisphosphate phosphatase